MRDERDVRGVAHYNPRKGGSPLRGLRDYVSQVEFKIKKMHMYRDRILRILLFFILCIS